ncbi:MAG: hypothetical protein MZW92_10420 [Comamonadaceae bacterium]|nr:hypothetical protein [Comamonadaceae bacterium]
MGTISPSPLMTEKLFAEIMIDDHPARPSPACSRRGGASRASSTPA